MEWKRKHGLEFMYAKWKRYLYNMKLSGKMTLVFLVTVGMASLLSLIFLETGLQIYDRQICEKSRQELNCFSRQVNYRLEEIETLSKQIAIDADIQKKLTDMSELAYLSSEYYYELQSLRELLMNRIAANSAVESLVYTDNSKVRMTLGKDCGELDDKSLSDILKSFSEAGGGYEAYFPTEKYPYLLSGRDILESKNASLEYLGSILLSSDISGILKAEMEEFPDMNSNLLVYSADGIVYEDMEMKGMPHPSLEEEGGYDIIDYRGQKMFLCYEKSTPMDWMFVTSFPYSQAFGQIQKVRCFLVIGFVAAFLAACLVVHGISRRLMYPLEKLSQSVKIVADGRFQEAKEMLPTENGGDEVGILTQEFAVMLEKIDALIHENYEKQLILQDTRYRMLQAQINPHFLYNTLNTLNWMIRAQRNQEASRMIVELGKLLRAAFAREPYTTIREELKTAESYIAIQQIRYRERVEFVVEEDGDLDKYMVPRMILQPVIENSINYGVEQAAEICRIQVRVQEKEDEIVLEVADTGEGMDEETLAQVRSFTMIPKGHGIGLKNISERLKIAFSHHEMLIDSKEGEGTRISIRIPKMECIEF